MAAMCRRARRCCWRAVSIARHKTRVSVLNPLPSITHIHAHTLAHTLSLFHSPVSLSRYLRKLFVNGTRGRVTIYQLNGEHSVTTA